MTLVLSLFPGVGLLDIAFEREGFCVVRGPDTLWGGDIRLFHPPAGKFDGVIGGPPCQEFSPLARIVRHNGYQPRFGNLIPEFERVVREAQPQWFLMENVKQAPIPSVDGYAVRSFVLNNRQCRDENREPAKQHRARRWSWGWLGENAPALQVDIVVFENPNLTWAITGGEMTRRKYGRSSLPLRGTGTTRSFRAACQLQGLPVDFDLPGFTVVEKCRAVGNGVPLPMGRAVAKAVREAIS